VFEENSALQRASAAKRGGLFNSRNESLLRTMARMAAFICGWECFSSVMAALNFGSAWSRTSDTRLQMLTAIMAVIAVAFAGLGVLIFMRQPRWTYVVLLAFLVLQVFGTMAQAPISLAVVISGVLTALTAVSMRAAFQLATVRRGAVTAGTVEKVFS
jgi:hypothetical protein